MTWGGVTRGSASIVQVLAVSLAILGVVYRATYYWKIPVAPGEPYGVGDVIDFFFAVLVLMAAGTCLALGFVLLVFPRLQGRRQAVRAILVGVGSVVGYYVLHGIVPRLL